MCLGHLSCCGKVVNHWVVSTPEICFFAELWRPEVQDYNAILLRFSFYFPLCSLTGDKERMEGGKGKEEVRKERGKEENRGRGRGKWEGRGGTLVGCESLHIKALTLIIRAPPICCHLNYYSPKAWSPNTLCIPFQKELRHGAVEHLAFFTLGVKFQHRHFKERHCWNTRD